MSTQETPFLFSIASLDWIAVGLFLVLGLLGAFRGAAWQFRRFLGVLLALLVAGFVAPLASPTMTSLIDPTQPKLGAGISYLLLFLLTLCVLALLFKILQPAALPKSRSKKKAEEENTSRPQKHRLLGFGFGLLTAMALYCAMITSLLLLDPQGGMRPSFTASHSARWTSKAISSLGAAFPLDAHQAKAVRPLPGQASPHRSPQDNR